MDTIIGHTSITTFFDRCINQGGLSHAYAFVGPRHVGKRTLAEHISRKILSITSSAFVHPDLITISREVDEKTEVLKKDISITQIRELVKRFSQSAFVKDGYVVALIDGAEYLNIAASNALLKTLEEPRTKTIIFLITEDEHALLPTIRSRVQTLYFSPVPEAVIRASLSEKNIPPAEAALMARDAQGMPGLVSMWVLDRDTYTAYTDEKFRIQSLFSLPFHEKVKKIEDFFIDTDDHIEARAKIIKALRVWILTLRDMMLEPHNDRASTIPAILDTIQEAEKQLRTNINPRLVVEHILLSIP